jgi:tetratricopeptide (TPR) repeat protein
MNRNVLFFILLFTTSFFASLTTVQAGEGQGIAYYKAGFPLVAKPLLISEIETDPSTRAETCFYLGNIYFKDNQTDSAAYYFNKGLVADPLNALNSVGLSMLKIKSNAQAADLDFTTLIKQKQYKKDVDVYVAIANAYLFNGVLDQAVLYQEKAKAIKTKYAPVYVLLGDIELAKKNVGNACSNYDMAIYYDDKCKEAYIKYARAYKSVNTPLAIEKLNVLKSKEPSFLLVDKELADIYYTTNEFSKARDLYANYLKSGNSNVQDLTQYALILFLNGEFAKSLEVDSIGLINAPRNPALNRLAMYNNVDLKQTEKALKSADLFFNKTDDPKFTYLDYRYYGQALRDSKQIDLAIPQFEKALQIDSTKIDLWQDISDMFSDKANYKDAIATYTKYMNLLADEKKTPDVMMKLGKMHYGYGTEPSSDAATKKSSLQMADSIFGQIASKEPTNYRGNFWRARANSALDPETTLGLAKPYYEQTAALVEPKAEADPRYNSVLVECYRYLGYYYFVKKDNANSLLYWNKILAIDANNTQAKDAIEGINKVMKAKK